MKKMKDLALSLESDLLSPSSILTPSTVKSITQLLESQDCLKAVQNYEKTGVVNDVEDKKTFFNSAGFNGGTTTVLASTAFQVTADSETTEEVEDCLPEPVVQTNRRMLTRSLSRTIGNSADPEHGQSFSNKRTREDEDPDYEPESPPPRKTRRGNPGAGRKSALRQHYEEENLSPEERERLRIRRLRNKEAAARCRKRRVDQTNSLQKEVEVWMKKKEELEDEIQQLKIERDNLTFVLQSHCANPGACALAETRVPNPAVVATAVPVSTATVQIPVRSLNPNGTVAVKSEPVVVVEPVNAPYMLPETLNFITAKEEVMDDIAEEEHEPLEKKPQRPSTLGLSAKPSFKGLEDVTIETPSRNVPNLSFDAFIATGFTPSTAAANTTLVNSIAPTASQQSLNTPSGCSSQQRSSGCPDLSTPIGDAAYLVQSL